MNKDIKSVEELMKILTETNLTNISFEEEGFKVDIKKANTPVVVEQQVAEVAQEVEVEAAYEEIKSENVGNFYCLDKAGAPMIKVGDAIKEGQEIGYISTIGVKSAVKSKVSGTVKEILAENGSIADFGKVLVKVEVN